MIKELIRLSNHLDTKGLSKEADYLDAVIKSVAQQSEGETDDQSAGALECQKTRRSGMGKCVLGPLNDRIYRNTYQYPLPPRRVQYAGAVQQAEKGAREQFIKDHSQGLTQEQIDTMSRNLATRVAPWDPNVGRICVEVHVPTGALPGRAGSIPEGSSGDPHF